MHECDNGDAEGHFAVTIPGDYPGVSWFSIKLEEKYS